MGKGPGPGRRGSDGRINLTNAGEIEVELAGATVRVRRGSRLAGALFKLLVLEAVQMQPYGCCTASEVRDYLARRGVNLPARTVYYYLRQLAKIGALSHSYGVYSVTPHAGDVYRGLLRYVLGSKERHGNDSDNCKHGVGGRRRYGRRIAVIPYSYDSSSRRRGRRGPPPLVVPLFPTVEGTEVCWRLWDAALDDAVREGGFAPPARPRREMKYSDGRFFHVDLSATRGEQEAFLSGYYGDLVSAYAKCFIADGIVLKLVAGWRVVKRCMRVIERLTPLLVERPEAVLDAWADGRWGGAPLGRS